jgi:tRNA nucleotidyltransferase/poly(A) polymerase
MIAGKEAAGELQASAMDIVLKLQMAGYEAFFVGGCVRDLVRGVEPGDYDIVTSARPDDVQKIFSHTVPVGVQFGVVLVIEGGRRYEVATYRTEDGGPPMSALPRPRRMSGGVISPSTACCWIL